MWAREPRKLAQMETQCRRSFWQQVPIITFSLRDDAIPILVSYTNLSHIVANKNQIENLENLKALIALKNLIEVDFSENPVSAISNYREALFNTI